MTDQANPQPQILIVDDEQETRVLLRAFLEAEGVRVLGEASGGAQAILMAKQLHPDVVLMDVRMPGMNGIEATKKIRAMDPGIEVIILTFLGASEWTEPAEDIGAFSYLVKGSPLSILIETVRRAAAQAREHGSEQAAASGA